MNQSSQPGGDGGQPKGDQRKATLPHYLRSASSHYAAAAKDKYEVAKKYVRKTPQAILWLLGCIWRGTGAVVTWLDSHNGIVTAAATFAIAVLTYYVVQFTAEQGKITNRQLAVMEADQRPWIKTAITFASDLIYKENDLRITFHYVLKNVGRSPALNVGGYPNLRPTILFPMGSNMIDLQNPMEEINKFCTEIADHVERITQMFPWGVIIYPGESNEQDMWASIDVSKLKARPPPFVHQSQRLSVHYQSSADLSGLVSFLHRLSSWRPRQSSSNCGLLCSEPKGSERCR